MDNVSCDSLDEIYQDIRKAFEEKLEALVTKLKGSVQYDELITMREKAYEVIEEFKTIEEVLPERIVDESHPDNFRLLRNLMMLMELLCQNRMSIKKLTLRLGPVYRKKCLTVEFLELSN
jgi:hypothetical protein